MEGPSYETKGRVLVLGDSDVGKTSLVHRFCYGTPVSNPGWTVGCNVEVKLHLSATTGREHFIEIWDLGGSARYDKARPLFYTPVPDGPHWIILVHDLTNRKSYRNLWKWLDDVQTAAAKAEGRDFELTVPMLLVGTKADLLSDRNRAPRRAAMAEELNCPAIEVSNVNLHGLGEHVRAIDEFFDAVLSKHIGRRSTRPAPTQTNAPLASGFLFPGITARDTSATILSLGGPAAPFAARKGA